MATSFHPLVFFLACVLISSALVPAAADIYTNEFKKWMKDYSMKYNSRIETLKRFAIFKDNYRFINESNNIQKLGFTLGLNQFADLTNEEFRAQYTGYTPGPSNRTSTSFRYKDVTAPSSVNWTALGAVTGVKNQGQCGSCWAFGSVATIEGITKIKKGYLPNLSEQELVSCVTDCNGCAGGNKVLAYEWVINNGGITTEEDYAYTAQNGTCDTTKTKNYAASITGYEEVPTLNETALMNAVANQPVAVSIEASGLFFQFYSNGIFRGPCGLALDHTVTVVGYGGEGFNKYWILKNSWDTTWGENGYMRMWKDTIPSTGVCGIAIRPAYPVV